MARVKFPKRVGGVKIPKKVRRRANDAIRMAESPAMRDLASAAIDAARSTRRASTGARVIVDGEPLSAAASVRVDASKFGEAFRTAALDGFRRFLEGFEEGLRESQAAPAAPPKQPKPPKPPRAAKPAKPPKSPKPPKAAKPARPTKPAKPAGRARKPSAASPAPGAA